jgi:arginase family enzyme
MAAPGRRVRVSILGVPTTAGSHNPGQEKAPAAWRAAGLADRLREAGVADLGSRFPLLRPGQVVLFGFDPAEKF